MHIGLLGKSAAALALLVALTSSCAARAPAFKVLYAFCAQSNCADGNAPDGTLLRDAAGVLYGTTITDGAHGGGNVFALTPNGSGYDFQVLYDFCSQTNCADGAGPYGGLIEDVEGNLYGTTVGGGPSNYGVAYELIRNQGRAAWTIQVLYNFCTVSYCANGAAPESGLTYKGASSGALYDGVSPLYGTTQGVLYANSSVFFELEPQPHQTLWHEDILNYFCPTDGCVWSDEPNGVFDDGAGNFYGSATGNGAPGYIFELTPRKNAYVIRHLHDFSCQQLQCAGGTSIFGVIRDQAGNFFGAAAGGSRRDGLIYELTPSGSGLRYKTLHNFCRPYPQCSDGALPSGPGLTLARNGDLYGSTESGGKCQQGVLFRLRAGRYRVAHDFCGVDGSYSATRLTLDPHGKMFGTTSSGGIHSNGGTVFEFKP